LDARNRFDGITSKLLIDIVTEVLVARIANASEHEVVRVEAPIRLQDHVLTSRELGRVLVFLTVDAPHR